MKVDIFKSRARIFYNNVLKDPARKNILIILFEYLRFFLIDKSVAQQYFTKFFYRRGFNNYSHYVLPWDLQYKSWTLNNPAYISLLNNKYLFERYFSQFNIRIIKSFSHNYNSLFLLNDGFIQINSLPEFKDFLMSIFSKESCSGNIFIKRTKDTYGGVHTYKISANDVKNGKTVIENLFQEVISSEYLFQETIIQHDEMNKINPYSLNTIRIDTYTNKQGVSKIMSCFMRAGVNRSHVDNFSSGGVLVGINTETGILYPEANSSVRYGIARSYREHPDSGFRFGGFRVPFFREAGDLVLKAATHVPQLRVIGWDVAITPDGPVLVEGNHNPGIVHSEIAQKGFYNNPVVLELLEEIRQLQ